MRLFQSLYKNNRCLTGTYNIGSMCLCYSCNMLSRKHGFWLYGRGWESLTEGGPGQWRVPMLRHCIWLKLAFLNGADTPYRISWSRRCLFFVTIGSQPQSPPGSLGHVSEGAERDPSHYAPIHDVGPRYCQPTVLRHIPITAVKTITINVSFLCISSLDVSYLSHQANRPYLMEIQVKLSQST